MKISNLDFIPVRIPLASPFRPAWSPNSTQTFREGTVVRVESDNGKVGYGWQNSFGDEVKTVGSSKLIWKLLSSVDISRVEEIVRILSGVTYSLNTIDLWGIEVAIWDILGKNAGKAIHQLLSGTRDRIQAYASTGTVKTPREHAADALKFREMGFRAMKIRLHNEKMEDDISVVGAVRDTIGPDEMKIMVDANQASTFAGPIWPYERALETGKQLEKLEVYWLEEPLHHELHKELSSLCKELDMLVAGGEDESGFYRYKEILDQGCFDIVQPDTCTSGGILQLKQVAEVAESMNRLMVPHAYDSGIDLAAALQVIGAVPNCPFVEYGIELPSFDLGHDGLLKTPIEISNDGYVKIPKTPGLGVEIDDEFVEKHRA